MQKQPTSNPTVRGPFIPYWLQDNFRKLCLVLFLILFVLPSLIFLVAFLATLMPGANILIRLIFALLSLPNVLIIAGLILYILYNIVCVIVKSIYFIVKWPLSTLSKIVHMIAKKPFFVRKSLMRKNNDSPDVSADHDYYEPEEEDYEEVYVGERRVLDSTSSIGDLRFRYEPMYERRLREKM